MMMEIVSALESMGKGVFLVLVNASLQVILLILLVWLMIRVFRLNSAVVRYHLWFLAVFGILALPLLGALLPGVNIPVVRSEETTISPIHTQGMLAVGEDSTSSVNMETAAPGVSREAPGRKNFWTNVFRPLRQLGLISIISLVWLVIALFMLCRLIRSYVWLRHFKRRSQKVAEGPILEIISRLRERMTLTRRIDVFISPDIHSPTSFGLFSTAIILPESLTNNGDGELEMVLSHEMAHAKRHDYLVNLFQRILQSIFFFHPIFHIANRRLTREREHICDDWVIQATGKRDDYAECLVGLVENAHYPRSISVAMMGHQHNISRRVDMIIDSSRGIVTKISRKAGISIFLVGCVLLPMLAATQLVYTAEKPMESVPGILDTEERPDILEEAEADEGEEGETMEQEKKVKVAGIPDLNLGAAIREAVGKPEGVVTEVDFRSVTKLKAGGRDIRDITGIEKCVNLEELVLSDNAVEDINPLAQLTKLTSLSIRGNGLTDITPLSSLTNLTVLSIPANQISDLTPLSNLTNLTLLRVESNRITDLEPLSNLTNLTKLVIARNQIADITPLAKLTNLSEELHAGGNQIVDLAPLSNLTNLKRLVLSGNRISDVSPLSNLTNLERLALGDNQISNVGPLAGLTKLTELLNLSGNRITDITPLSGLTNLVALSLDGNQVSDISPLSNLPGLERLGLRTNKISDIKLLANLTNLTGLDIAENEISDIAPLANLTNLTILYIYDNRVSSVEPLSNLINLTNLAAAGNWISDVEPLSNLTSLTNLALEVNQVSDITPLSGLTNLTNLGLFNNPISDIKPLSNLANLNDLQLIKTGISDVSALSSLTNLTRLGLIANEISDITPLSNLTNLTGLGLNDNQISDITPLSNLTGLTDLRLGANEIDDVVPLSSLTELTNLELYGNRITDIKPLSNLTGLTNLRLGGNKVSDIAPLSNLTDLADLEIYDNQIEDISPLAGNEALTSVMLQGNPLNEAAINVHIPELGRRGAKVLVQAEKGSTEIAGDRCIIEAGGQTISKMRDSFRFVYREISGDFTAIVRAVSLEETDTWAEIGLMVRQGLSPAAKCAHVLARASDGNKYFRRRYNTSEENREKGKIEDKAGFPVWLKLTRSGDRVFGFASSDGDNWVEVGKVLVRALNDPVLVGISVAANSPDKLTTGVMDGFTINGGAVASGDLSSIDIAPAHMEAR
ncbi:leucine-rich repeat domain-containing protein [Candidatus Poribacteria bacterium]